MDMEEAMDQEDTYNFDFDEIEAENDATDKPASEQNAVEREITHGDGQEKQVVQSEILPVTEANQTDIFNCTDGTNFRDTESDELRNADSVKNDTNFLDTQNEVEDIHNFGDNNDIETYNGEQTDDVINHDVVGNDTAETHLDEQRSMNSEIIVNNTEEVLPESDFSKNEGDERIIEGRDELVQPLDSVSAPGANIISNQTDDIHNNLHGLENRCVQLEKNVQELTDHNIKQKERIDELEGKIEALKVTDNEAMETSNRKIDELAKQVKGLSTGENEKSQRLLTLENEIAAIKNRSAPNDVKSKTCVLL